jgi:hypothetical protein
LVYDVEVRAQIDASLLRIERSRRLLARAAALHAEVAAVMENSRDLLWDVARRRDRRAPGREIRGGSDDTAQITAVLAGGGAWCIECIARKTGIPPAEVELVMVRVGKTIRVRSGGTLCDSCLSVRRVFQLA